MGLIVPQTVKVRTNGMTCKHYREKGYEFEKCGDFIEVDVFDLPKGSHEMVKIICDVCGKEAKIRYCDVFKNNKNNCLITCNNLICIKRKSEDTCMKKYGVKNVNQSEEVKNKRKETNLERYGCICPLQSEEAKKKIKETCIKKYGVDHYSKAQEIKDKRKKTCQLHYGVNNPNQSQEIKNKKIITYREHFGVDHPSKSTEVRNKLAKTLKEKYGKDIVNISQVKEIQDKIKATNLERYGCEYSFQSEEVKKKIKETNNEKYGCNCVFQSKEVKDKIKQTIFKKYGVEYPLQSEEIKNKVLDSFQFNGTGPSSRAQRYINYILNGILNKHIYGSLADIYIEKENIIIEYDGGGHFLNDKMNGNISPTKESLLREKEREDKIINNGYRMIRFIATKDRIPSDEVILNLIEEFKNSNFKVIRIDFEKGIIEKDYEKKSYRNFGELRKITKEDLEQFEK